MTDDILVVGGYGTVGRTVCETLVETEDITGRVFAGGRRKRPAREFAAAVDGLAARRIDVTEPDSYSEVLEGIGTVVICIDQDDPTFAEYCLERGIEYIDVSPTDRRLRQIESFDETARNHGGTGVLSVGLSPGVTNLFVASLIKSFEAVDRTDITLLLGLGEAFGPDTIRWTLEEGWTPFSIQSNGSQVQVNGLSDPRTVDIPGWGRRRVYRANLADQHVLARTTGIPTVETRLCYGSRLITNSLAMLHRAGLVQPFARTVGIDRISRVADRFPFGTDESVVCTSVIGDTPDGRIRLTRWIRGPDQARATALVAATVVLRLLQTDVRDGVHHIHQLFGVEPFINRLTAAGYSFGRAEHVFPDS